MTEPLLDVRGLCAGYGATEILRGVDLAVGEGEIVAVLGSNGAGKSTLNRTISGVVRAWRGAIRFDGVPIEREKPAAIVARGLKQYVIGQRRRRTVASVGWTSRSAGRRRSCCRCTGWPPRCPRPPRPRMRRPGMGRRLPRVRAGPAPTGSCAAAGSCWCRATRRPVCGCRWTRSPGGAGAARRAGPSGRQAALPTRTRPAPRGRGGGEGAPTTALAVQARGGLIHVFLPPIEELDPWMELIGPSSTPRPPWGCRWCWRGNRRRTTHG